MKNYVLLRGRRKIFVRYVVKQTRAIVHFITHVVRSFESLFDLFLNY